MKRTPRLAIIILTTLFIGAVVAWILYVPDNQDVIYESIPAEADFVTSHHRLAERFDGLLENDHFVQILDVFGVTRDDIEPFEHDPEFRKWLERLASRRAVLAHIPPNVSLSRNSSWVMSSWIGSDSPRLRWTLELYAREEKLDPVAGTPLWRFDLSDLPERQKLYCAIEEGVLLAAISDSANAIHRLVLTYQGRSPSITDRYPDRRFADNLSHTAYPDQCWVLDRKFPPNPVMLALRRIENKRLEGLLHFPSDEADEIVSNPDRDSPSTVEWDDAIAQAVLTKDTIQDMQGALANDPNLALGLRLSDEIQNGPLFLAVLGGGYQGRFKGFRIPGLLAAMPVKDQEEAVAKILEMIDRLNAMHSYGLIYHKMRVDDTEIYAIQGTKDNLYGSLPDEEQIAFTVKNGLLLFGSHVGILQKISAGAHGLDWADPIWDDIPGLRATSYIGFDLNRSAKALRLGLAVYSLKMIAESPLEARRIRKKIDTIKDWIDSVTLYDNAIFWSDDNKNIHFKFGAAGNY